MQSKTRKQNWGKVVEHVHDRCASENNTIIVELKHNYLVDICKNSKNGLEKICTYIKWTPLWQKITFSQAQKTQGTILNLNLQRKAFTPNSCWSVRDYIRTRKSKTRDYNTSSRIFLLSVIPIPGWPTVLYQFGFMRNLTKIRYYSQVEDEIVRRNMNTSLQNETSLNLKSTFPPEVIENIHRFFFFIEPSPYDHILSKFLRKLKRFHRVDTKIA